MSKNLTQIHLPYLHEITEERFGGRISSILLSHIFNIYQLFTSEFSFSKKKFFTIFFFVLKSSVTYAKKSYHRLFLRGGGKKRSADRLLGNTLNLWASVLLTQRFVTDPAFETLRFPLCRYTPLVHFVMFKDCLPSSALSDIINIYRCISKYIGRTSRTLLNRTCKHTGIRFNSFNNYIW